MDVTRDLRRRNSFRLAVRSAGAAREQAGGLQSSQTNVLLKAGNKSDTIDVRKLAELLRAGLLSPVYHGQNSTAAVNIWDAVMLR